MPQQATATARCGNEKTGSVASIDVLAESWSQWIGTVSHFWGPLVL